MPCLLELTIYVVEGRKEGIGFLRRFQQLGSYRDERETRNREEIP